MIKQFRDAWSRVLHLNSWAIATPFTTNLTLDELQTRVETVYMAVTQKPVCVLLKPSALDVVAGHSHAITAARGNAEKVEHLVVELICKLLEHVRDDEEAAFLQRCTGFRRGVLSGTFLAIGQDWHDGLFSAQTALIHLEYITWFITRRRVKLTTARPIDVETALESAMPEMMVYGIAQDHESIHNLTVKLYFKIMNLCEVHDA